MKHKDLVYFKGICLTVDNLKFKIEISHSVEFEKN